MFRIGQKVVCVDNSGCAAKVLTKGEIYLVLGPSELPSNTAMQFNCAPLNPWPGNRDWYISRFRPIVERKTDISIFTEMLKTQELTE